MTAGFVAASLRPLLCSCCSGWTTGRLFVLPGINRSIDDAHPARPVGGRPVARQDGPARFPPPAPAACTAGGTCVPFESFQLTPERHHVQPMRARREEEEGILIGESGQMIKLVCFFFTI